MAKHGVVGLVPSLAGVPEFYEMTVEEARGFTNAFLDAASVPVVRLPNPTMIHGFMWMSGVVDHANTGWEQVGNFARENP